MRERELREHATCSICGLPIGHTQLPLFWTVTVTRHGINMEAMRRQDGLTALWGGNARLAHAMGTDSELTEPLIGPMKLTVCETCAVGEICIAQIAEMANGAREYSHNEHIALDKQRNDSPD